MDISKAPFNIQLLQTKTTERYANNLPIQVMDIYQVGSKEYHIQGLYSDLIFGAKGSKERSDKHSHIDLKMEVMHPAYFFELNRLRGLYGGLLRGTEYATWDKELKDFVPATIMEGETGPAFFYTYFEKIVFIENESRERSERIKFLMKYRPNKQWVYTKQYVIPAGIRDVEEDEDGRPVEDDINNLYRRCIAASNVVNAALVEIDPQLLDLPRVSMQVIVNGIFDHVFNILGGKHGVITGKVLSRRIFETTRNVLTAQDPSNEDLDSPYATSVNHTTIGLYQFIKGTVPLVTHATINGVFSDIFDDPNGKVPLINPDTMEFEDYFLSAKARRYWGAREGVNKMMNQFKATKSRHAPMMIDDKYVAFTYDDGESVNIIRSLENFPEDKDKSLLYPTTWAEFFYWHAEDLVKDTRCFNTRYPCTGEGSIYANNLQLRTTLVGHKRKKLTTEWAQARDDLMPSFPDTKNQTTFFNGMSVSPLALSALGADFDGDKLNLNIVYATESVVEIDDFLSSPRSYLSASGGLRYSCTSKTTKWVLRSLTRMPKEV